MKPIGDITQNRSGTYLHADTVMGFAARMEQMGYPMSPTYACGPLQPSNVLPDAGPRPFSRKPSHGSTEPDCSHASTELDDDSGIDELANLEADMAKSKKAVKSVAAPSASDPGKAVSRKRPAAAVLKRPAAASIAKRPATACAKFDVEPWAAENFRRAKAECDLPRKIFR